MFNDRQGQMRRIVAGSIMNLTNKGAGKELCVEACGPFRITFIPEARSDPAHVSQPFAAQSRANQDCSAAMKMMKSGKTKADAPNVVKPSAMTNG